MAFYMTRSMMLAEKLSQELMLNRMHAWDRLGMGPHTASVSVEDVLTLIGEELWKELPVDMNGPVLILHLNGCYVQDAGVVEVGDEDYPLQVRIDPASQNHPEGSVCIGYGQGNFESFRIPPGGVIGL